MLTVQFASMQTSSTTVVMPRTLSTCSTITLILLSIKFNIFGGWIGGEILILLLTSLTRTSANRMTVFTFLEDKTQEDTTIEFTGEDPYLQYVWTSLVGLTWNLYRGNILLIYPTELIKYYSPGERIFLPL